MTSHNGQSIDRETLERMASAVLTHMRDVMFLYDSKLGNRSELGLWHHFDLLGRGIAEPGQTLDKLQGFAVNLQDTRTLQELVYLFTVNSQALADHLSRMQMNYTDDDIKNLRGGLGQALNGILRMLGVDILRGVEAWEEVVSPEVAGIAAEYNNAVLERGTGATKPKQQGGDFRDLFRWNR